MVSSSVFHGSFIAYTSPFFAPTEGAILFQGIHSRLLHEGGKEIHSGIVSS